MTTPFRLALIGVDHPHGAAWRESLRNLAEEEIDVTAIVPAFGGATTSLEERLSGTPRFDTVSDLVSSGQFDGAVVCLPNAETPAALVALIEAGKHVLVEKPAAGSADAFRPVADALRRKPVAFQTGYAWRYDSGANRLRQMVAEGRFGRLTSVEMRYFTSDAARRGPGHYLFDATASGGGFFNWLGCHWLDLLLYLTGDRVAAVTARTGVFGATPLAVEDGGTIVLEMAGGSLVTFTGGYWLPRWAGESGWTLRGSERWVHWHPSRPGTGGVLEIHGPQPQWHAMEETYALPADDTPGYSGYRAVELIRDWLTAARATNPADCRNTCASALVVLELLDLVYRSSREGRRLECDLGPAAPTSRDGRKP